MMHPENTPAFVSFDQVTVRPIGTTAGLRTTPLVKNQPKSRKTSSEDVLYIEQLPKNVSGT